MTKNMADEEIIETPAVEEVEKEEDSDTAD